MIYTQHGVKVQVIAKHGEFVIVQGVDEQDSDWIRRRQPLELRADGGWKEIQAAIEAAPVVEIEEDEDVEPLARPRNPLTGHFLGGDRGGR